MLQKIKKGRIFVYLYCLITALLILLLTTKNSPLYPFNDWVDANAFFTMGKGIFNGKVMYRDLFEQKGPILYLIYGFGYLISHKSFLGVFILEVIMFSISLYFLYKTLRLFLSVRSSLIILPIFSSALCTSFSFVHGGSAEEFSMLFFFVTLYYFFKHFKVQELSHKEMIINGVIAGIVFLIKYTLLGFWLAFTFSIFIDFILKKKYKKAFTYPFWLLLGMILPIVVTIIYFLINKGLMAFVNNYFYVNITVYAKESVGIFSRIKDLILGLMDTFSKNTFMEILLIVSIIFVLLFKVKKRVKWLLLLLVIASILGVYWGLKFYPYYLLFILLFSGVSYLVIFSAFDKYIIKLSSQIYLIFLGIIGLLCLINAYYNANYADFRFVKKSDLYQYQFADIINKYPNASLVNMGHLDCGLYTTTGIVPSTYFFQRNNISYNKFPDNIDAFQRYIKEKATTHIIYHTKMEEDKLKLEEPLLFENYQLIAKNYHKFENISL